MFLKQLTSSSNISAAALAKEGQPEPNGDMEPTEGVGGRSFVEVMSEKYSPENFPYRRGPGMGVVVVVPSAGPQGSPMKGELSEH